MKRWIKDLVGAVAFGLFTFLVCFAVIATLRGWT